ncbi:hypothetical protein KUL118_63290 [Tenacibaculum sp. KUL118]|nr:hypothetical protein KUL118_63290 [Tenacibaculum sp. KUL118]
MTLINLYSNSEVVLFLGSKSSVIPNEARGGTLLKEVTHNLKTSPTGSSDTMKLEFC